MGYQISETFKDFANPVYRGWVNLVADKPINPGTISYPIIWTGLVSGKKIEIIQLGKQTASEDDFIFSVYPAEYTFVKRKIVDWINNYLSILN